MNITGLRVETAEDRTRSRAQVVWEDSDRPPLDLYFESDASAGPLRPGLEPFLVACALPAMRHGERRIRLEGTVCPRLSEGVAGAVALLRSWYGPPRTAPVIEPSDGFSPPRPSRPPRAAFLFSGGVDSLDLLLANRRAHRTGDDRAFAGAVWATEHRAPADGVRRLREALSRPLAESGVELLPISTNVTALDGNLDFFAREFFGAALLSNAHAAAGRFASVAIASTAIPERLSPWGSHPALDPLLASAALEVRHERLGIPRLAKVRAVAGWAAAMQALHVCNLDASADHINCGACEKCVETMAELIAAGHPGPWPTFPRPDLDPRAILALPVLQDTAGAWRDLPGPLQGAGRADLAGAVREKLRERDASLRWHAGSNWSGPLRRLDRRLLGGRLLELRRRWLAPVLPSAAPRRG